MKTLILYATKYGTAEVVAQKLSKELDGVVDLVNIMIEPAPSLELYDTVILGGSIYMGRIQKQLTKYMKEHIHELEGKTIGLYICAAHPEERKRQIELQQAFPDSLNRKAAVKAILGYVINFEKMKLIDKLIMRKVKGDSNSNAEFYENRIRSFCQSLHS